MASTASRPRTRTYRGMTAEQRQEDRRRRLLDAALDLFASDGYAKATIESLCSSAGVSPANFYDHFDGRAAVMAALYEEIVNRHAERLREALAQAPRSIEDYVRHGVQATVHGWLDDERAARVALIEVGVAGADLEPRRLAALERYAEILTRDADLLRTAVAPGRDLRLLAVALVGAVTNVLIYYLRTSERPELERLIGELTAIALGALQVRSFQQGDQGRRPGCS